MEDNIDRIYTAGFYSGPDSTTLLYRNSGSEIQPEDINPLRNWAEEFYEENEEKFEKLKSQEIQAYFVSRGSENPRARFCAVRDEEISDSRYIKLSKPGKSVPISQEGFSQSEIEDLTEKLD